MATKKNKKERDKMYKKGKIWCSGHEAFHYHSQFSPGKGNYGFAYKCKAWLNEYQRSSGITKKMNEKRMSSYHETKGKLVEFMGGKCIRCGHDDVWGLEFHHVLPTNKKVSISKLLMGDIEIAKLEVDKCVLICRNCHIALDKSWKGTFVKGEYGWKLA